MKVCDGCGRREEEDEGWEPKAARESLFPLPLLPIPPPLLFLVTSLLSLLPALFFLLSPLPPLLSLISCSSSCFSFPWSLLSSSSSHPLFISVTQILCLGTCTVMHPWFLFGKGSPDKTPSFDSGMFLKGNFNCTSSVER